jgi:thiol-disulfide isomerase/thioredoxin
VQDWRKHHLQILIEASTMRFFTLLTATLIAFALPATAADLSKLKPWSGDAPPPLALNDLDGKPHKLSDYRGKVVVMNFWATWCGPCVKEMPDFEKLAESLSEEKFSLITVNFGEKADRIKPFLKKIGVNVPVLLDPDMGTSKAWVKSGLPTTYVIDAEQNIRYQVLGAMEWGSPEMEDKLRELLPR